MSQLALMQMHTQNSPVEVTGGGKHSPATELSLVTGYDEDGWPEYEIIRAGDHIFIPPSNKRWLVIGFLTNDYVLVSPAGLDIDPAITSMMLSKVIGCTVERDEPITMARHRDGLVSFEWAE